MPRKKSNNTILWVVLGVIFVVLIVPCVGFIGVGFFAFNNVKPMVGCLMSFSVAEKALKSYATEHDGKLPPAASWQDDLRKYYKQEIADTKGMPFDTFKADGEWSCGGGGSKSGVAFNATVDGKKYADLASHDVILFETNKVGTNQSEPYKALHRSESPTIMGTHRGWITVTNDDVYMDGERSSTSSGRSMRYQD